MQSLKKFFTPKRRIWAVVAFIVVILLIPPVRIGWTVRALWADISQAKAIATAPSAVSPAEIDALAHRTRLDLTALDERLSPFYGVMRRVGGDAAAVPALLPMGVALAEAGDTVLPVVSPLLPQILNRTGGAEELLASAASAIAQNPDAFARAAEFVDIATARRAEIDVETLSPRLAQQVNRLDTGLPLLKMGLQLAPAAPELLGIDSPKTYMLLAENNDEMRATGGFISAVGLITLDGGKMGDLSIEDSYAVDDFSREYPPAPEPMKRILSAYLWVFRDGNWSPDFPTAVQDVLRLYHISRDTEIDGVIAVDQIALQMVVAALEPVSVPGFDEPATGDNVIEQIRRSWSPNDPNFKGWDADWYANRKNFMGDLVAALRNRIENDPASVDWLRLAEALVAVMDERHAQIWLSDPQMQTIIAAQGWDGAVLSPPGDFLLSVESNVGFNKMSAAVETNLDYHIDLSDLDKITAATTITQTNLAPGGDAPCQHAPHYGKDYWDMMDRCYWNYWRLYVPAGSTLVDANPPGVSGENLFIGEDYPAKMDELADVAGKSGWGTLVFIPRGETVAVTVRYQLPQSVLFRADDGWHYRLTVQKQAGTRAIPLRVRVSLPPGRSVVNVSPAPQAVSGGELSFTPVLKTDRKIEVVFQ